MNIIVTIVEIFDRYSIITIPILLAIVCVIVIVPISVISSVSPQKKREIKKFNSSFIKDYMSNGMDIFRHRESETKGVIQSIIIVIASATTIFYIFFGILKLLSFKHSSFIITLLQVLAVFIGTIIGMLVAALVIYTLYIVLKTAAILLFHLPKRTHMRIRKSKEYKDE